MHIYRVFLKNQTPKIPLSKKAKRRRCEIKERLGRVVELNYQNGGDQKVKISPVGQVIGIDGRAYNINGAAVVAATLANELDLPLDINHGYEEAAGWFARTGLEARDDGIYGALELNSVGDNLVKEKLYKYLSPVYVLDDRRNVLYIESVGLVNAPNLLNNALNSQQNEQETKPKQGEKVGDKKESNATEANAAEAQKKEIEGLREANKRLREHVIDAHIKNGSLPPAHRDFALKLEDGLQAEFLELNKVNIEHLKQKTQTESNSKGTTEEDAARQHVNNLLGIEEAK